MQKTIANPTVIQKLQAKKNKKGFTLVELVIVIAILAILAAIAIPVVISTIASANINTMESDTATVKMLAGAAANEYASGVKTKYNAYAGTPDEKDGTTLVTTTPVTAAVVSGTTKIGDVLVTNSFTGSLQKQVNGTWYCMTYNSTASKSNTISLEECGTGTTPTAGSGKALLTYATTLSTIYGTV